MPESPINHRKMQQKLEPRNPINQKETQKGKKKKRSHQQNNWKQIKLEIQKRKTVLEMEN